MIMALCTNWGIRLSRTNVATKPTAAFNACDDFFVMVITGHSSSTGGSEGHAWSGHGVDEYCRRKGSMLGRSLCKNYKQVC